VSPVEADQLRAPGALSGDDSGVGKVIDEIECCLWRYSCVPRKGSYGYRRLELGQGGKQLPAWSRDQVCERAA
jgi:hypothetical protein